MYCITCNTNGLKLHKIYNDFKFVGLLKIFFLKLVKHISSHNKLTLNTNLSKPLYIIFYFYICTAIL